MGVTYKLTDEIINYIINERKANAILSCRALAEAVEAQFSVQVSKSSIHDVLKQANIVSSRGRKPKDVFAIPHQKKQVIKADLSKALLPLLDDPDLLPPAVIEPAKAVKLDVEVDVTAVPTEVAPATVKVCGAGSWVSEELPRAGDIFVKAVFWDLCPQRVLGIKSVEDVDRVAGGDLALNWKYLIKQLTAIKVSLEDGSVYYLDARTRGIYADNPKDLRRAAPIERVIGVVVDRILNNKKPLVLGAIYPDEKPSEDFLGSFSLKKGKRIQKIEIVDEKDHIYADFASFVDLKREFIVNNMFEVDLEENIAQAGEIGVSEGLSACLRGRAIGLLAGGIGENWKAIEELSGRQEMNNDIRVVTISIPNVYENRKVLERAIDLVNSWAVEDEGGRTLQIKIAS